MTRESGSDRDSQRTVADLLAKYGETKGDGGTPRRRRRRADDTSETAPHQIINRVLSDSAQMRAIKDVPPVNEDQPSEPAPTAHAFDQPSMPRYGSPSGRFAKPTAPPRSAPPPQNQDADDPASTTEVPAITQQQPIIGAALASGTHSAELPAPPKPAMRVKPRVQPEPITQQLPKVNEADQLEAPEQVAAVHTSQHQVIDSTADEDVEVNPDSDTPAGLAEEEQEEESVSPVNEWLIVAAQIGGGVLGGAGLWVAFQWLWRAIPAITLFLALGVIAGLVLLVRKIRQADDLQTLLLSVLVGLVVTVSPAALLLVIR